MCRCWLISTFKNSEVIHTLVLVLSMALLSPAFKFLLTHKKEHKGEFRGSRTCRSCFNRCIFGGYAKFLIKDKLARFCQNRCVHSCFMHSQSVSSRTLLLNFWFAFFLVLNLFLCTVFIYQILLFLVSWIFVFYSGMRIVLCTVVHSAASPCVIYMEPSTRSCCCLVPWDPRLYILCFVLNLLCNNETDWLISR